MNFLASRTESPIKSERHRTPRYSFQALVDLTDSQSEKRLAALTKNLSLFGCCVKTATPFPDGTKVRLRIWNAGMNFVARGRVVYSRPIAGMGIAFITIEPRSKPILDTWLRDLGK